MIDFGGFIDTVLGKETTVVFLVSLDHPLALKHEERHLFTREQEEAPWVTFTGGKGFVGLMLWEVPDVPDPHMRQDINSELIAQALVEGHDRIEFPRLGSEYKDVLPAKGTVVELATPIKVEQVNGIQQVLSDAFDRCLEELNVFLDAYITVAHDPNIKPVRRQNCRPFIPMLFQNETGDYFNYSLFGARQSSLHFSHREAFSDTEVWNLAVALSRRQRNDPFSIFVEGTRAAHRHYVVDGDYSSTVIAAQTACEVFLNSVLLSIEWEKGTPRKATRPWFEERVSFLSRVSRYLVPALGGSWSNPPGKGVSNRLSDLAKSRNEIVHNGKRSNELDAKKALEAIGEMETLVKRRLAIGKRAFPRTTLLVLGESGLRRLDSWDTWIEKWVEEHAAREPDWIVDFVSWRDSP